MYIAFNSLALGGFGCKLKLFIFKLLSKVFELNFPMNLPSVPQKQTDDMSTLVQVMAECDRQTEAILTPIVVTPWRHYATKG